MSGIIDMIKKKDYEVEKYYRRGLVITSAALGDCILMLPMISVMKEVLDLGLMDMLSNTDYTSFYPGRTAIDKVRSINVVDIHRLFVDAKDFCVEDKDPLIYAFANYQWIVSFIGQDNENFEKNLIFTVNCANSAHIITIPVLASPDYQGHISQFYIDNFLKLNDLPYECCFDKNTPLIHPAPSDTAQGKIILKSFDVNISKKLLAIHPGSGGKEKCWPVENYISIANEFKSRNIEPFFILGPVESEKFSENTIAALQSCCQCISGLTIDQVQNILCCSDAFLGNDSGLAHLSAAMSIPTVTVFGPTEPQRYSPIGPKASAITLDKADFDKISQKNQDSLINTLGQTL
ncbi:MAG: glycosyltransferase family 9 protein [Phycisphaerae bacterium]|nr:glycosyltransferase family 9 protein [Phycisphaerae bacterium]